MLDGTCPIPNHVAFAVPGRVAHAHAAVHPSVLRNTYTASDAAANDKAHAGQDRDSVGDRRTGIDDVRTAAYRRADSDTVADSEPDTDSRENAAESGACCCGVVRINGDDRLGCVDLASLSKLM